MKLPIPRMLWALLLGLLLAGCASNRVDWQSRIGNYTYDQAIIDMGPPDKEARLKDGTVVAEWLEYRGSSSSYHTLGGFSSGWIFSDPPSPDVYNRLTFAPDGRLVAQKRVSR